MIDYSIIDKWYGGYLPTFKTLLDFSIMSNELTKEVILTPLALDKTAPTAYMNNGQCVLPGLFFLNDFYEKILGIENYSDRIKAAISVINGSQIHESLHHKYLSKEADWLWVLDNLDIVDESLKYCKVLKDCFNIVEDIYSNYRCSVDYSHIFTFVDLLDRTMFNQHIYDKCYEDVYKNRKQINDVLSMLACHKNSEYDNTINEFTKEYQLHINLLKRARNENLDLKGRYDLAKQLYELLKENHDEDEDWDTQSGYNKIDSREASSQEHFLVLESIDDLYNIETKFKSKTIKDNKDNKIKVVFEDVNGGIHYPVKPDRKFLGFSKYIKNARAEKQKAQEPRLSGTKILPNRLFTALSDGKIFGRYDNVVLEKGNPQLIFLLDWSGSMESEGLTCIVSNAMLAIFRDLKENGIANAVYAHTTKSNTDRKYDSLVKGVAAYNMPLMNMKQIVTTNDYEQRFSKLYNVYCTSNADGVAIEFVGKRFKNISGKKALFVLSDGEPSVYDTYSSGIEHTKVSVENLRKSNISVVSLSLVEDVVSTNDEIYGKKHNIRAYGSNLQTNLKKLVSEFVI